MQPDGPPAAKTNWKFTMLQADNESKWQEPEINSVDD